MLVNTRCIKAIINSPMSAKSVVAINWTIGIITRGSINIIMQIRMNGFLGLGMSGLISFG